MLTIEEIEDKLGSPNLQRNTVGKLGEQWAILKLQELFPNWYFFDVSQEGEHCDIIGVLFVGTIMLTLCIEVKTARQNNQLRWKFQLWKDKKANHTGTDIVIMLQVLLNGEIVPYIVPTAIVREQKQATIHTLPFTYRGKLSPYLHLW